MRPMLHVVSIASSGRITHYWQSVDLPTARRLAAAVAARLRADDIRERVAVRGSIDITRRIEFELDADGELPNLGPMLHGESENASEGCYGQVGC